MVYRYVLIVALVLGALPSFAQQKLPANAEYLRTLVNDQNALVDAARGYHLQQIDLTDWDYEIVQDNGETGDEVVTTTKAESMRKRIDSIREVWEFVLAAYPNSARAMNYFGEFWYDTGGNSAAAINYWKRAIAVDSKLALAHNNLGIYYFHTGDYRNGLRSIETAVELEPKNPDILFNITQMYLNHFPAIAELSGVSKQKLYQQAMKYSAQAATLAPTDFSLAQDYAVNFFAAENFELEADWAEAAMAWQKAQALASTEQDRFYSILNEARCWIRAEQPATALPRLEAAQVIEPESEVVETLIAETKLKIVQ